MLYGAVSKGACVREAFENTPKKMRPHSDSDREPSTTLSEWRRVHAALLTNEFGQVQVKCSRKKPTWPSGRRNGIWVASRSVSLSFSLYLSLSPTSRWLLACDSPLTDGSHCTILTTVHYPRLWFFGRGCLAGESHGEMHSREMQTEVRSGDVCVFVCVCVCVCVLRKTDEMGSRWDLRERLCEALLSWDCDDRNEKSRLPRR